MLDWDHLPAWMRGHPEPPPPACPPQFGEFSPDPEDQEPFWMDQTWRRGFVMGVGLTLIVGLLVFAVVG